MSKAVRSINLHCIFTQIHLVIRLTFIQYVGPVFVLCVTLVNNTNMFTVVYVFNCHVNNVVSYWPLKFIVI